LKASVLDSSMRIMEDEEVCNTFYYLLSANENFDTDALKKSLQMLKQRLPIMNITLKKGFWRDRWECFSPDANDDIFEIDIGSACNCDSGSFYENAYEYFRKMENKSINIVKEKPFKVYILHDTEKKNRLIIFCFHHAFMDGRGALQVIKQIIYCYNNLNSTDSKNLCDNFRNDRELIKSVGRKTLIKELKRMKPPDVLKDAKPLVKKEENNEKLNNGKLSFKIFTIDSGEIAGIKKSFEYLHATITDVIIYCCFAMLDKLNEKNSELNKGLAVSTQVDLRRYLKNKNGLTVGNFFAPQSIVISAFDAKSKEKVFSEIKKAKNSLMGLPFYSMINVMSIFPIWLINKFVKKLLKVINEQLYIGMSVSNLGKLDEYFKGWENLIDDFTVVTTNGICGIPTLVVSTYKGKTKFIFSRYNDDNNLVQKFTDEYREIIYNQGQKAGVQQK
jgi:NRPS condensation-like uncharacterized protein